MTACDFTVNARIIASDGTTVVREFHDHDAGVHLQAPLGAARFGPRRARTDWMHNQGDVGYGVITKTTGLLVLNILLTATAWTSVETLWDAIEADVWAETDYFIETEIEGVTRRYITDVPSYGDDGALTPADLSNGRCTMQLRFIVQPNPVTTIV